MGALRGGVTRSAPIAAAGATQRWDARATAAAELTVQIVGKDFGPVFVKAESGMIVAADRPVSYMRGWELRRAIALAERWHWKFVLSDDERVQLEQQQ
jgi:hypothetical protein